MLSGAFAVIAAVAGLLSVVLEAWINAKPQRAEEKRDEEATDHVQAERGRIAVNDGVGVDAVVADQHDRVRLALGGGNTGRGVDPGAETDAGQSVLGQRSVTEGVEGMQKQ